MFHISLNIFPLLHKEQILHNFKLCILCLHLPAGQHSKSMHKNIVCKFHYRGDLMISAIRCEEKYTYISVSVSLIDQMSRKISAYWISAKNPISCIPNLQWYSINRECLVGLFQLDTWFKVLVKSSLWIVLLYSPCLPKRTAYSFHDTWVEVLIAKDNSFIDMLHWGI